MSVSALAVTMYTGGAAKFDCRGDSTMKGHDVLNPPTYLAIQTAPQRLQAFLRDYFSNLNIIVTNNGVNNTSSGSMLDGTDGAGGGLTFEQQMAISDADVVPCNHGLNDCQMSVDLKEYHDNLTLYVKICRDAGKLPLLVTPNPIWALTTFSLGTMDKANRLKAYVQVMKDVAAETLTDLVDVFTMVHSWIRTGRYRVQDIIPDGVHPTAFPTYSAIGSLLAMLFVHPQPGLSRADQTISVAEGIVNISPPNNPIPAPATRTGSQLISTAAVVDKSIEAAIRVDEPGLDIWIAVPLWAYGTTSTGIVWDGILLGSISQFISLGLGSEFVHDHEICIARNVTVGMHSLSLVGSTVNSIGLSYIRTRPGVVSRAGTGGAVLGTNRNRSFPISSFQLVGSGADGTKLIDDWAVSRFLAGEALDVTFDAVMGKDTQFVLHGIYTVAPGGAGPMTARMAIGVGLDAAGYANVYQITGAGTYATTAIGSTDLSSISISHKYRLRVAPGTQSFSVWVDGNLQPGCPVTIGATRPFPGGFMGLRANVANRSITVSDLRSIEQ